MKRDKQNTQSTDQGNEVSRLLAERKRIKAKKPNFIREDADKKSIGIKWRRPTGRHSKIKHQFKGSRKMPSPGYRSPILVRGLTRQGLLPKVVHTSAELEHIDAKREIVVIGHDVGKKKRAALLKLIIEKKLPVYQIKDPVAVLKSIEEKNIEKVTEKKEEKRTERIEEKGDKTTADKGTDKTEKGLAGGKK